MKRVAGDNRLMLWLRLANNKGTGSSKFASNRGAHFRLLLRSGLDARQDFTKYEAEAAKCVQCAFLNRLLSSSFPYCFILTDESDP